MSGIGKTNFKIHSNKFPNIYRGIVVDNNDPLKYGRVKVKVIPMLVDVEIVNLPWYPIMPPVGQGSGNGTGNFAIPALNTHVFVMFEQGDIYQGLVVGEAPNGTKGLPTERLNNYPNTIVNKLDSGVTQTIDNINKAIKTKFPLGTTIISLDGVQSFTGNLKLLTGATDVTIGGLGETIVHRSGVVTDILTEIV